MSEHLMRIELPWATFGLEVRDGWVVRAAPIARWTEGRTAEQVARYYRKRGARVTYVTSSGR